MIKVFKNSNLDPFLKNKKYKVVNSRSGKISEVSNRSNELDWNQSSDDFYFHQDGSHLKKRPDFVALFCVNVGDPKTKTIFTDTNKVYKDLIKTFDKSFLMNINAVYIDKDNRKYLRPLIEKSGSKFYVNSFSYAEPNLKGLENKHRRVLPILMERLLLELNVLKKKHTVYEHSWSGGDLVFYDNRIYQHSRINTNPKDKNRKLLRIWLNKNLLA